MAKDKKAKKAKTGGKRVAGVKVPKELRSAAAKIADHPVISDVIAAGLLAAAAALTEPKAGKRALNASAEGAEDAAEATAREVNRLTRAARAAAGAMGNRIIEEVTSAVSAKAKGRKSAQS